MAHYAPRSSCRTTSTGARSSTSTPHLRHASIHPCIQIATEHRDLSFSAQISSIKSSQFISPRCDHVLCNHQPQLTNAFATRSSTCCFARALQTHYLISDLSDNPPHFSLLFELLDYNYRPLFKFRRLIDQSCGS